MQGHPGRRAGSPAVRDEAILLVEDGPDDELMTERTLKNNLCNDVVVVARDGAEALEYLFATGTHQGRDPSAMPQVVLLDLEASPRSTGLRSWGASGPTRGGGSPTRNPTASPALPTIHSL